MALLKEYDKITVLCGGNFNRRDLVDFEIANAMDDDFKDVMKHRKRWIHKHRCRKSLFVVDIVIGFFSLFALFVTLIPVLSDRVAEIAGLQPFASNSTVIWTCAIGCGFALLYPIAANKFKKRDDSRYSRLKRVWDNGSSENDIDEAKMKTYMRFINKKRSFLLSAEAYWLPIEGHVSDAQIVPFLTAKTGRNIELAFSGTPYFQEYFADSLCLKVISGTTDTSDQDDRVTAQQHRQQDRSVQKTLKKVMDEHIIHYFLALGTEYPEENDKKENGIKKPDESTRLTKQEQNPAFIEKQFLREEIGKVLKHIRRGQKSLPVAEQERSTYIFGILFLSRFLNELFYTMNQEAPVSQGDFIKGKHKPIGIHFERKYRNLRDPKDKEDKEEKARVLALRQDLEAIRFLLKASTQPPFLRVYDEEIDVKYDQDPPDADMECCIHLMITDIVRLLPLQKGQRKSLSEITKYRKSIYAANKGGFRLPVKRTLVLPNENNPCCPLNEANMARSQAIQSVHTNTLVLIMGGAEQNYSIQTLVSMQSWQNPTLRYQLSENQFRREGVVFRLSSENLVHSLYYYHNQKIHNQRIEMTAKGNAKIRAHVYSINTAAMDLLGVYGYNARATKIVAMCLVYFLTDLVGSSCAVILHKNSNSPMTPDEFRKKLFENEPLLITVIERPDQNIDTVLAIWDDDDIINQHDKFPAFFEMLQFEVLTV